MQISQRLAQLNESPTLAVSAKAARMKADGIDVISFGAGEPDFTTPETIRQAVIDAINQGRTKYPTPASGLTEAKRAVCTKLKRENNLSYKPEQVLITSGGKMACYLAIQAIINPGDEVIIPAPYWVSYPEFVRLAGGVPVFVTADRANDYKLTPEQLSAALTDRTRAVFFNSPSNPTGVTYTPDEVRALAEVLQERDVTVIADEIYDRLVYDGHEALSYASINDACYDQTITINSASKTYAMTGWRIAYIAANVPVIKAMAKLQSQTTSGAATFTQIAFAHALEADQQMVESMRVEFEQRGQHMWERVCALPGVTCPKPTGAFYCFPDVSGTFARLGVDGSVEFASRLLEESRVAVVPGIAFGMDTNIRLSFASSMEVIDKGIDRMVTLLSGLV